MSDKYTNPESHTIKEQNEYFTTANDDSDVACDDNKFVYAINEFGAPGMEFKDWVTSQSVDPQVIKNHSEFVKGQLVEDTQIITGRTYSPDSHDSYDPIPWQGLRRPEAVQVRSPTQVPDVDYDLYNNRPSIRWGTK